MTAKRPDYMDRTRKQQSYDPKKIFIERLGKKVNLFDLIQEAKEESDITLCMKKYGCITPMGVDLKKTYEEFMEIHDLRDIYEAQNKADKLWDTLPIEVRSEFANNKEDFMKNGEQWLKDKIAQEQKPAEQPTEQQKE